MSKFRRVLCSLVLFILAGCTAQREIIANYCLNWDSIQANPICDGSMSVAPPSIEEAIEKTQKQTAMLCSGDCSFTTPSQVSTILNIATSALKVINYLEGQQFPGASTDYPAVMDFTEESIPDQQRILTTLYEQAESERICTTMAVGPYVIEVAEVATVSPCLVFGIQRPDSQNTDLAIQYFRADEDVDLYHGVTDSQGMGTMFTTGIEEVPASIMVKNIVMQHPKPTTFEYLCKQTLPHLATDGSFTIVPDQDYINNTYGQKNGISGTQLFLETLTACVSAYPEMTFQIDVFENTTPEAVRELTGYNAIASQRLGKVFSYFTVPDGTPMTIFVIRRDK